MASKSTAQQSSTFSGCFRSQLRKTALCRHYSKGKCRYGSSCLFAHSEEELQNPPCLVKTSICKAWMEGTCPFESHLCTFAHGRDELKRTPAFQRKRGKVSAVEDAKVEDVRVKAGQAVSEEDSSSCDGSTAVSGTCSPCDDSVESEGWETNTQYGFESEDEFECAAPSPWVSERYSSAGKSSQLQQEAPQPVPSQMYGNYGCYVMGQAPHMQGLPMQPVQGGNNMPWPANVTFVPVLMVPSIASPPSSA
eukprot:6391087-Amphidinium_carterae.2